MEIPRKERFQYRLPLSEIFSCREDRYVKSERDKKIFIVFRDHAYTQKEIADFLGRHYSTLSSMIKQQENN